MRSGPRSVRGHLRPARGALTVVVATGAGSGLVVIAQAWAVTGLVLSAIGAPGADLARWAGTTALLLLARGVLGWVSEVASSRAATQVGSELRARLVEDLGGDRDRDREVDGAASGATAVLVSRGVGAAEPYLTRYVPALVLAAVLPPLAVLAIASQDLLSAAIVLLTLPLVPVFGALVGMSTRDRAERQWRALGSLSGHFVDVVRGLPTLVAYRRARAQSGRVREVTEQYRLASRATLRLAFASSAVLELVATLSVALVAVTVGLRVAGGSLDLRTAMIVLLLAPEAYWPLRRVGAEFHAAAEGAATFAAADAILRRPAGTQRPAAPEPTLVGADAAGAGCDLVVTDLTVVHPGRRVPALHHLDARFGPRGVTVVVGPSGCGKSTLLDVLCGLLEPTAGAATLGGLPLTGVAWQRQVARLPQQPVFVSGTVGENLRLGRPDATAQAQWSALRQVALEVRVRALPRGLDTPVAEDGLNLSAGERARLALAQVVLAERPWVVLDEPTAHLDPLTEQVVLDTIADLGRRAGVVVVAHRAEVLTLADHVLRLPAPDHDAAPHAEPAAEVVPRPGGAADLAGPSVLPAAAAVRPTRPGSRLGVAAGLGALASGCGVALTATAGWLLVQAADRPPVLTLMVAIVGVRAFGLGRPLLRYAERLVAHDAALGLLAERRVAVFEMLVPLTPARLGRRRGDLLASVVDDVDAVVDRELRVRLPLRSAAVVVMGATAVAAFLVPAAGAVVLALGAVSAVASRVAFLGARSAERRAVALRARLSAEAVETVQQATHLRMWQQQDAAAARIRRSSDLLGRTSEASSAWAATARALVLATIGLALFLVATLGADAHTAGLLGAPLVATLVLIPLALGEVLQALPDAARAAAGAAAAQQRLDTLGGTPPAVRDTVALVAPEGREVALARASARWSSSAPVTRPVSTSLAPGDRVALQGPSGSGKSTVAALLVRFLDPCAGEVTLGGAPARSLALDTVRSRVALVDDSPHLFATSLAENVRLARPAASDDAVLVALQRARLGPWVAGLPDGLATWLGDGHAAVSGGERARIGVARALLADVDLIVLDEPTSHLDHQTATELAHDVLGADADLSVLWMTHGHVGIDQADRVVDLGGPPCPPTRTDQGHRVRRPEGR